MKLTNSDIIRHPFTKVTAAFTAASTVLHVQALDIIAGYAWVHVGELFTLFSVAMFTSQNTGLPENHLTVAAVLAGIAFGGKKVYEMGTELSDKLDSES